MENFWEQTGHMWAWNHPLDTCFSPLQVQAGCTSKQGASAEHLGWQIEAVVLEELILKAVLCPEAHIMLYLSILGPQCMFGCEHGLGSCTNGVYLTQHRKRHGLDVIGLFQLQKLYLPIHIKWIYSCWFKEMSVEPKKKHVLHGLCHNSQTMIHRQLMSYIC